jgi:hypothetical protein
MARALSNFKQGDIARALRAMKAAGFEVRRLEIAPDGRIIIATGRCSEQPAESALDEWISKRCASDSQE